jgi:hypothetical protein
MALAKLADKDELGNPVAHFFKSGNVLRGKEFAPLIKLKELIPEKSPNGNNVEYDIWYDFEHDKKIHGYCYTDTLTQFIYLRVASSRYAKKAMRDAATGPITEEGERLFREIAENSVDKYRLRKKGMHHDFVIFLPGTNILNTVVDFDKVERAVKQGAMLKCHPLTSPPAFEHLKHRFGDAIIEKKVSGHELLENASIVGYCNNSEMGMVALAKGKTTYHFGYDKVWMTYTAMYKALEVDGVLRVPRFKAMLSSKTSGLVPATAENPQEWIDAYFKQYAEVKHVLPKNTDN